MDNQSELDFAEKLSMSFFESEAPTDHPATPPSQSGRWDLKEPVDLTKTAIEEETFDYHAYIQQELKRMDAEALDPHVKKKLVQKIRNRLSAQRSRNRQKNGMTRLEAENAELKTQLSATLSRCRELESENRNLREKLVQALGSFNESDLADIDGSSGLLSSPGIISRTGLSRLSSPIRPSLFVFMAIVCAALLVQGNSKSPLSSPVRTAGLVPAIATSVVPTGRQLQTIEQTCRPYCDAMNSFACQADSQRIFQASNFSLSLYDASQNTEYSRFLCKAEYPDEHSAVFVVKKDLQEDIRGIYLVSQMSKIPIISS